MKTISIAIAKAVDAHMTEIMLCLLAMPFLAVYWKTRDQLIGTVLGGLVGGLLAICQKRVGSTTNVANVENVESVTDLDKAPKV